MQAANTALYYCPRAPSATLGCYYVTTLATAPLFPPGWFTLCDEVLFKLFLLSLTCITLICLADILQFNVGVGFCQLFSHSWSSPATHFEVVKSPASWSIFNFNY